MRYAIRLRSGRLWRFKGKTQSFKTPEEAQVWLMTKHERVVEYKKRRSSK